MDPLSDPAVQANPEALMAPPYNYVVYGPTANCTLDVCPASLGVYQYQPKLDANAVFIAFYGIALLIHLAIGIKWRTWVFMGCMVAGCASEMIGYGGRIMLHYNPFDFSGFMVQIVCITIAPVFFTAAIYVTLSKLVIYLGTQYGRFAPKLYYWVFIPCDILSLILQSIGGALSSESSGTSDTANAVSLAGLSFQVFVLVVFISLSLDYAWSFWKNTANQKREKLTKEFKIFVLFLLISIILILMRCIYRIDELSEGYYGPLIKNEALFIGLEGVTITISAFTLIIGHPGYGFPREVALAGETESVEAKV